MYYDIIEIGLNAANQPTVKEDMWVLSIDPIFQYIQLNQAGYPTRIKACIAMGDTDGIVDAFFVPVLNVGDANKDYVCEVGKIPAGIDPNLTELVQRIRCPQLRAHTVMDMYDVDTCMMLKIDTTSSNYKILESWLEACEEGISHFPEKIVVKLGDAEHPANVDMVLDLMKKFGYDALVTDEKEVVGCASTSLLGTMYAELDDDSILSAISHGSPAPTVDLNKVDEDGFTAL